MLISVIFCLLIFKRDEALLLAVWQRDEALQAGGQRRGIVTIGGDTFAALRDHAAKIQGISAERIREELIKLFRAPHAARGLDLLRDSGLLDQILPEVAATIRCEQSPDYHPEGSVYNHVRLMLGALPAEADPMLPWAVLLHDIAKPVTASCDSKTGGIHFYEHEKIGAVMAGAATAGAACGAGMAPLAAGVAALAGTVLVVVWLGCAFTAMSGPKKSLVSISVSPRSIPTSKKPLRSWIRYWPAQISRSRSLRGGVRMAASAITRSRPMWCGKRAA